MTTAKQRLPRWINVLLAVLISAVWLINAYKMLTGLRTMELLNGFNEGMCFFFGPYIIWESIKEARPGKNGQAE